MPRLLRVLDGSFRRAVRVVARLYLGSPSYSHSRIVRHTLCPHTEPDGSYTVGAPGEAVDPRTIEPKKAGAKTPRSQRGAAAIAVP